jgi:hypothetical protein
MKKNYKLFLVFLFLSPFAATAQDDYLDKETTRLEQVDAIEAEAANYVTANLGSYSLTQAKIDEITNGLYTEDADTPYTMTQAQVDNVLLEYKKGELRKLFFSTYPGKASVYIAQPPPPQLACVNGGFENLTTAGYTFKGQEIIPPAHFPDSCTALNPTAVVAVSPLNTFTGTVTLVDPGNEPLLNSVGVAVPRTIGNRSVKLNPTPNTAPIGTILNPLQDGYKGNRTLMLTSPFVVDEATLDFNFMLIGKIIPPVAGVHFQPFFRYRLVDNTSNAIYFEKCYTMDQADCRFKTVNDTRPGWGDPTLGKISYTPWICERINTAGLIGTNCRLEFLISDCAYRGHFATVYLDNLCGISCTPTWGSINLTPSGLNCPSSAFTVCGTMIPPQNGTLSNITLNIINANTGNVFAVLTNPTVSGSNFCFTINPTAVFGATPSGSYMYQVAATSTITTGGSCTSSQPINDIITGSLSFINCCAPTYAGTATITSGTNNFERSDWITSAQIFSGTSTSVYHATNFVDLKTGFNTVFPANSAGWFSAYPMGCTSTYNPRYSESSGVYEYETDEQQEEGISLVRLTNKIVIYPNPTNSTITVSTDGGKIRSLEIVSLDGKLIMSVKVDDAKREIDVSQLSNGMYLLSVVTSEGKLLTSKFIKN